MKPCETDFTGVRVTIILLWMAFNSKDKPAASSQAVCRLRYSLATVWEILPILSCWVWFWGTNTSRRKELKLLKSRYHFLSHMTVPCMLFVDFRLANEATWSVKGLISLVYLKILNHDENILAPKRRDCGWKTEDTWFITPLTNKIYSLHPPAITQMVRKLALCRDVDSGMNINMRQM